jgi:uncharacterized protein (TIGR02145 family)
MPKNIKLKTMKNKIWYVSIIIFTILLTNCKKENNSNDSNSLLTVTDIDGNVYHTIAIGTQIWMVENLKTTRYRNGDFIPTTTPSTFNISNETSPKYQWAYFGNNSNIATYGRLYTWASVVDIRNISPIGWHVPTDAEWTTLTTNLGGESIAGGKLKENGTIHWHSPNTGATNEKSFTALPSGFRNPDGWYNSIGFNCSWWSSTESESDTVSAYLRTILFNDSIIFRPMCWRLHGFSVRCIKD